jgi:hypothetical protein
MIFSDALEVAIGLTFLFLLLSLASTSLVEIVETFLKARGQLLYDGLCELMGDPANPAVGKAAAKAIYAHPLVQGTYRGSFQDALAGRGLPSYIQPGNFALTLIDQVLDGELGADRATATLPATASFGERLWLGAQAIPAEPLRRAIGQAVEIAGNDAVAVRAFLEAWYSNGMERVSGWYKRRTQKQLLFIGLFIALVMNVNTITVADSLARNATLRRAVMAEAEAGLVTLQVAAKPDVPATPAADGATSANADALAPTDSGDARARQTMKGLTALDQLGVPIGWSKGTRHAVMLPIEQADSSLSQIGATVQLVLGYILTALAIMLGAPFWFDVLGKLMTVRNALKPKDKPAGAPAGDTSPAPGDAAATPPPVAAARVAPTVPADHVDDQVLATEPAWADKAFEDADPADAAVERVP